jgi:hypothetical protein
LKYLLPTCRVRGGVEVQKRAHESAIMHACFGEHAFAVLGARQQ